MLKDKIKANFHFYLRDKNSKSPTPIVLYIRYNGKLLKFATNKNIHPEYWNDKTEEIKVSKSNPTHSDINKILRNIRDVAEQELNNFYAENKNAAPIIEILREKINLRINPKDEIKEKIIEQANLISFCDEFLENAKKKISKDTGKQLTSKTIASYTQALKTLKEYKKERYGKRIFSFEQIDRNFYNEYQSFLTIDKNYSRNTVGKHLKVIKTYFLEAKACGLMLNFDSTGFESITEEVQNIYLSESEIQKIFDLNLNIYQRLEHVRDLFIVACWTGLRFSDFSRISPKHITGDFIKIETKKTQTPVIIPIHPMVAVILKKYDNQLPKAISNQKMNDYLKEIAELAEISETTTKSTTKGGKRIAITYQKYQLVSTHTARRSFATNAYLAGMQTIDIMAITGHKTESAFMKYIKVTKEQSAQKILNIWKSREQTSVFKLAN